MRENAARGAVGEADGLQGQAGLERSPDLILRATGSFGAEEWQDPVHVRKSPVWLLVENVLDRDGRAELILGSQVGDHLRIQERGDGRACVTGSRLDIRLDIGVDWGCSDAGKFQGWFPGLWLEQLDKQMSVCSDGICQRITIFGG